jgi:hypothetical protein
MFGIQAPRNVKDALMINEKNGNTLRQDAIDEDLS